MFWRTKLRAFCWTMHICHFLWLLVLKRKYNSISNMNHKTQSNDCSSQYCPPVSTKDFIGDEIIGVIAEDEHQVHRHVKSRNRIRKRPEILCVNFRPIDDLINQLIKFFLMIILFVIYTTFAFVAILAKKSSS